MAYVISTSSTIHRKCTTYIELVHKRLVHKRTANLWRSWELSTLCGCDVGGRLIRLSNEADSFGSDYHHTSYLPCNAIWATVQPTINWMPAFHFWSSKSSKEQSPNSTSAFIAIFAESLQAAMTGQSSGRLVTIKHPSPSSFPVSS